MLSVREVDRNEQIATLYREGKGQREIARALGISQPAVRKRLLRLRLITSTDAPPDVPGQSDNPPAAPPAARRTAHFRAACKLYPHFSFNVPKMPREKDESKAVHFHHGILDTRAQGFTEAEADAIHVHLETLQSRPAWGIHIVLLPEETEVDAHDNRGTTGC